MGKWGCGVRRNGKKGLWSETEWDGGTVERERMGRRDCGVRWNGMERLWKETEWDGKSVV
jgi:hypothetical protein